MKKILLLALFILLIPTTVCADTGPKPSITVKLKNMKGTNYKIDLLSDCSTKKDEIVDMYSSYKNEPIYKYHEGNWYATTLRNFLLHGEVEGNKSHTHTFTYFGVPDKFKVIIQTSDGKIKVSDIINKKEFNYNLTIDVDTMKVASIGGSTIFSFIKILLITVLVELFIALLFKIRSYNVVVITNLITNSLMQLAIIRYLPIFGSLIIIIILEIIVFFIEYLTYLKFIKEIPNKNKFIYTLIANLTTALITFII